ncbi:hypothetical protein G9444_6762 (plasmid) [Rhodococcus erythropolis]|uniref:Uncharacterized protein n=1 Tax=Rhodococcus erythropolis TaxID=1833 RepID=A0A6G9D3Z7_RHOER|nr:hypothetical protein G9444_6762 [Rhodococcus erythropolis]
MGDGGEAGERLGSPGDADVGVVPLARVSSDTRSNLWDSGSSIGSDTGGIFSLRIAPNLLFSMALR